MNPPAALLAWYDEHRRDLPWRRSSDPYRVWISEIMLQQTRVETVIPYFERFCRRFPDVHALAAAEIDEVLSLWSGLGYYRRARQMHAAAGRIVERGGFPRSVEELKALPGIGDYTAAAVASIAFGVATPVLDGNVERVASRWVAFDEDPRTAAGKRRLRTVAARLVDPERPGDSNQAMMELGATICTPRRPKCFLCPLGESCCVAGRDPEEYPRLAKRRRAVKELRLVALVEQRGKLLFFRRPDDAELLAGIWELPWTEVGAAVPGTVEGGLAARYGGRWSIGEEVARVAHGITFRSIDARVHRAVVDDGGSVGEGLEAGWFERHELESLATSSLNLKALAAAEGQTRQAGLEARGRHRS